MSSCCRLFFVAAAAAAAAAAAVFKSRKMLCQCITGAQPSPALIWRSS